MLFNITINVKKCFKNVIKSCIDSGKIYRRLVRRVFLNNYWMRFFVISRIIKVEVGVISRSRRLRLITLTKILIILDIKKAKSNNCLLYNKHGHLWATPWSETPLRHAILEPRTHDSVVTPSVLDI